MKKQINTNIAVYNGILCYYLLRHVMKDKALESELSINIEYYTPKEVSILLNISIDTVYDMLREEQLPAIRLGTGKRQLWRIPIDDFRRFLKSIRTGPLIEDDSI